MDMALALQVEEAMKLGISLDESRSIYETVATGDQEAVDEAIVELDEERIARRNTEVMGIIDTALGM
jgi:hypothetical protein